MIIIKINVKILPLIFKIDENHPYVPEIKNTIQENIDKDFNGIKYKTNIGYNSLGPLNSNTRDIWDKMAKTSFSKDDEKGTIQDFQDFFSYSFMNNDNIHHDYLGEVDYSEIYTNMNDGYNNTYKYKNSFSLEDFQADDFMSPLIIVFYFIITTLIRKKTRIVN